jgi:hypothetical protein
VFWVACPQEEESVVSGEMSATITAVSMSAQSGARTIEQLHTASAEGAARASEVATRA